MNKADVEPTSAAYAQFASELCDAIMRFAAGMTVTSNAPVVAALPKAANDNDVLPSAENERPRDGITLKEIEREFRLKERQVVSLRRLWGFPIPWHQRGKLLFSRREVVRWARLQPDPENLAAVLRLRRRDIRLPKHSL